MSYIDINNIREKNPQLAEKIENLSPVEFKALDQSYYNECILDEITGGDAGLKERIMSMTNKEKRMILRTFKKKKTIFGTFVVKRHGGDAELYKVGFTDMTDDDIKEMYGY